MSDLVFVYVYFPHSPRDTLFTEFLIDQEATLIRVEISKIVPIPIVDFTNILVFSVNSVMKGKRSYSKRKTFMASNNKITIRKLKQ